MSGYLLESFDGYQSLKLVELEAPQLKKDEVLVEVSTIAINFPDLLVIQGQYQIKPPLPFTPGKEFVGTISAIGQDVSGFKVGDRVLAHVEYGAFARQVAVHPDLCCKIPDDIDNTNAVALGLPYQTAHLALFERAAATGGESVLIGGATGAVGLAAIELAKASDLTVIATSRKAEDHKKLLSAGADYTIDLNQQPLKESIRAQLSALPIRNGKVDIVLDPLGGEFFAGAIRGLDWCGRLVVIGFASGDIPIVRVNYLLLKNISLSGLQWSDYRDREAEKIKKVQANIFELYKQKRLHPHIEHIVSFNEIRDVFKGMQEGTHTGKTVATID